MRLWRPVREFGEAIAWCATCVLAGIIMVFGILIALMPVWLPVAFFVLLVMVAKKQGWI